MRGGDFFDGANRQGQDRGYRREHFTFSTAHDYLLADDCGHEILYLLEGDPDYIGPFETYLVEVRGELAGTNPSSRYEILEVKSIYRNDRNS